MFHHHVTLLMTVLAKYTCMEERKRERIRGWPFITMFRSKKLVDIITHIHSPIVHSSNLDMEAVYWSQLK
jgi:hypothetical protein